jgi:hypothetical protein
LNCFMKILATMIVAGIHRQHHRCAASRRPSLLKRSALKQRQGPTLRPAHCRKLDRVRRLYLLRHWLRASQSTLPPLALWDRPRHCMPNKHRVPATLPLPISDSPPAEAPLRRRSHPRRVLPSPQRRNNTSCRRERRLRCELQRHSSPARLRAQHTRVHERALQGPCELQ